MGKLGLLQGILANVGAQKMLCQRLLFDLLTSKAQGKGGILQSPLSTWLDSQKRNMIVFSLLAEIH
jgi:hypothetical protein